MTCREKSVCPNLQEKWHVLNEEKNPMVDSEREQDVVKQEAFGSRSGGSYVLGRSQNRIPNPIPRDVKSLEYN